MLFSSPMDRFRRDQRRTQLPVLAGSLLAAAPLLLGAEPAVALEELELRLPLIGANLVVRLDELSSAEDLLAGRSDLAELDRASDGVIGPKVLRIFNHPIQLPPGAAKGLQGSVGSPLLREALLATTALVRVDGLPTDLSGEKLSLALSLSEREGSLTLLSLLRAMPGKRASIDLERALFSFDRLQRQQAPAQTLLERQPAVGADPDLNLPGRYTVRRQELQLPVSHRQNPLRSVALLPQGVHPINLVFISHGLWDAPVNFEGWGHHLASHGYAVLLPEHPGSDQAQQAAMLSGAIPPPEPEELGLRPLDVRALLAAVDADRFALGPIPSEQVVVLGHSWGAITALQLAGLKPSDARLGRRCGNLDDPESNVSWVLQCSFLRSANQAEVAEPRVFGVVAVSPPMRLLFDQGASKAMNGRALVVSGSKDWVVPFGPEALTPFQGQPESRGHQLVLAGGGTHFNLRPGAAADKAVLRGLMLSWVQQVLGAGQSARPSAGASPLLPATGWGDPRVPLVEATPATPRPEQTITAPP
ncbi:alpha/beta hydrolase family protein [Synechococcus sp. CBW1107]|uniref:alpha/beta hydrolase family protein n=1 Tax=Synechococcus sp. CBW1107 TaxID=2789857 RepID=UPI002AD483CB|nr:alpha/beta fold hydrolase [Synechococcus sp. CBW1107]